MIPENIDEALVGPWREGLPRRPEPERRETPLWEDPGRMSRELLKLSEELARYVRTAQAQQIKPTLDELNKILNAIEGYANDELRWRTAQFGQ